MQDEKAAIRALLKQLLKGVTPSERLEASGRASALLLQTPQYQRAKTVMLFVSLPSEIDTRAIVADAWARGKRVTLPRACMETRAMEAVVVGGIGQDMRKSGIGVLEPAGEECAAPDELDLVLVPGLGFGEAGERIGRGAGFYDRFLSAALGAVTCGYAFERQVIAGIPMTPADTPIHMLITDQRIRRFSQS